MGTIVWGWLPHASPISKDFLFELVIDQLHGAALDEVQQMRLTGYSAMGEPLPAVLVWPWKGLVPRGHDVTRVGLVLTKVGLRSLSDL